MDAMTGEVLKQWDGLTHANVGTGPGGNTKTGQYNYGTAPMDFLNVQQSGTSCIMETSSVKTIDLQHSWIDHVPGVSYEYTCFNNTHKSINGGYAPLNDAHFFTNKVIDMYQNWYGISLPSLFGGKLNVKVHMGNNYQNAFWKPNASPPRIVFGDGASYFYPLVSLDVASHEIAHGFTNYNSDLIYSGAQSGGINEAFSDMAGEAAEFYLRGNNDWLVGADITKPALGNALRYMYNPTLDGISIDHASNFPTGGMDNHYSSGVFNKAFYLLANKAGWNTKTAFNVMVDANSHEWTPSSNFEDAACGAEFAALNRGYDFRDVHDAFNQVGVNCPNYLYYALYLNGNDNPPTGGGVQSATDNFPRETAANIGDNYYSGPPAAKATLSYITGASAYQNAPYSGSNYTGTQNDIYAHHALNDGNDMTADELEKAVNSIVFDPYYVAPSYDYPYHYGEIEETDEMDALKKIVYWADYLPNGGRHGPVMVPTFADINSNTWGANNRWKVIRGIVTTPTSATGHGGPYKTGDQSQLTSINVIGFLVNAPMLPVNDLGYYTYQSATDFQVDYHLIDSKYRAVLEPPINREEAEIALDNVELSIAEPIEHDELHNALSIQQDTRKRRTTRDGRQRDDLVVIVRDIVIPGSLILDPVFNPIIKAVKHARTFIVDDLDTEKPYVVIALGPESNDKVTVLVQVNSDNGAFMQATWDENEQGQRYLKLSEVEAKQIAEQQTGMTAASTRLIWSAQCSPSRFHPCYEVNFGSENVIVSPNGDIAELKKAVAQPASCQLYAVNDKDLNDSQFFTMSLDDLTVSKLGPMYHAHDIESLAIHPETNIIYAASGDNAEQQGHIYLVGGKTGELFPVGNTGFKEIEDLAFDSDGTLWAWAKGNGLITIDPTTGIGTLVLASNVSVEGLTLSKEPNQTIFYGSVNTELWMYDMDSNDLQVACTNLLGETEALEIMPYGGLLVGTHNVAFGMHVFNPQTCQVSMADTTLSNKFKDVEGIALPVAACSVCGDGVVQGNEQCDDGNAISGDRCSDVCLTE